MKAKLTILLATFSVIASAGSNSTVIKLLTEKASINVRVFPDTTALEEVETVYYTYENPADSVYVILRTSCGRQGMDPAIKCRSSYDFVDAIPDGAYTILIDNKVVLKVSFVNGKKRFECSYGRRQIGTTHPADGKYVFVTTFNALGASEYVRMDKRGRVFEYRPVVRDELNRIQTGITYFFYRNGQLRELRYGGLADVVVHRFSRTGKYKTNDILGYDKSSERYKYRLKRIEQTGFIKNKRPDGLAEIKSKNYDPRYNLNFKKGVLVSWQFLKDDSQEHFQFNLSSDEIAMKGMEVLEFMEL